ncbi:PP2C family serine/threonine-protein phosphatase [Mycoplasmatota bacterium WC44]
MFKFTYAGGTVIGEKHIQNGTVCEDANSVYQDDEILIIVIADGHGSDKYEYSNIGSQLACDLLVKILKENSTSDKLKEKLKSDLIDTFITTWEEECLNFYNQSNQPRVSKHEAIEKFGSTCLFVMLMDGKMISGKIGDGNVFLVSSRIDYPFGEDYEHSNITKSLISDDASDDFEIIELELQRGVIVLSTDGHVNSFATKDVFENHLNMLSSLVVRDGVEPIKNEFYNLLSKISKEGCGDDISMFVVNVEVVQC